MLFSMAPAILCWKGWRTQSGRRGLEIHLKAWFAQKDTVFVSLFYTYQGLLGGSGELMEGTELQHPPSVTLPPPLALLEHKTKRRQGALQPVPGVWMSCYNGKQRQASERGMTWWYWCQRMDYAGDWCHSWTHSPKGACPCAQRRKWGPFSIPGRDTKCQRFEMPAYLLCSRKSKQTQVAEAEAEGRTGQSTGKWEGMSAQRLGWGGGGWTVVGPEQRSNLV